MDQPSIPGYEGLRQIGKGGFSRVFEATQQKFRRQVAIKVLNFGVNDEGNRRAFSRETQVMGRVSTHPNIVTVYDTAFTDQGQPCIVMELCSGGTIAERIQEQGALPVRDVLDVGAAIASALHASHSTGVLHRDIKPQNILISDFGQPALSDFGISAFDDDRAQTGDASGFTLHYAAPEVIEGEAATVQSDIYSLGATLYTAAAGQRPFASPGTKLRPGELARRVLLETPAPLTNWGVPSHVDALIAKALSKEPDERFGSAQEFATALATARASLDQPTDPAPADSGAGSGPFAAAPAGVADHKKQTAAAPAVPPGLDGDFDTGQTVLRKDYDAAQRRPSPSAAADSEGADDEAQSVGSVRTWLAVALPVLAIGAVALLVLVLQGGDSEPETVAETPTPVVANAVDPIRAPEVPSDVVLERLTPGEVLVRWSSADAGDDTVSFELRRSDVESEVIRTTETEVVLGGIAGNEQPCVRVLAIRGSRVSAETPSKCAELADEWVEVLPNTCSISSCTVRLRVSGLPDGARVTVAVTDPEDRDLNGFAPGAYDTNAELNADGDVVDWRLELGTQLDTGRYNVRVSDDVDIAAFGFFTVTE